MMMRIVAFEPDHLTAITPRAFEAKEMLLLGNIRERAQEYLRYGPAFTGVDGDQIVGCAGLVVLWPGVAEAWAVSTHLWPSRAKSVHKAILHGLRELSFTMGLWRIQTAIHGNHEVSYRWLLRMGFKDEGDMPGYGPDGVTYLRMALIDLAKCHRQQIDNQGKSGPAESADKYRPNHQDNPDNQADEQPLAALPCIHSEPSGFTNKPILEKSQCHF
jgi:hypothetical protein